MEMVEHSNLGLMVKMLFQIWMLVIKNFYLKRKVEEEDANGFIIDQVIRNVLLD